MGKIGLFDSGFGGLAIMRHVVARLPLHDFVYLGDTANNPYGGRSPQEVYDLTQKNVQFLFDKGCGLVVVACNTASSEALRTIQQQYLAAHAPDKKVLGVIIPAVEAAVVASRNKRIGVIATEGTIKSGAFVTEITKLQPAAQVYQQACPMLVPLIEAGEHSSTTTQTLLRVYLAPLLAATIDTLILGCTHYGLLRDSIEKIVGPTVKVVDEGPVVAEKLADYLARHPEVEKGLSKNSQLEFYSTAGVRGFNLLGSEFYGSNVAATQVRL